MDIAKIKDLQIDMKAVLNQDQKRELVKLIEGEFSNKNTLYHQMREHEEAKIIEAYRKEVGFEKLLSNIKKAEETLNRTKTKLDAVGLDEHGGLHNFFGEPRTEEQWLQKKAAEKLSKKIQAIQDNAPSSSLRAKLITRMHLARTYGEAMVIMHEILGNDVLPAVSKQDVKLLTSN